MNYQHVLGGLIFFAVVIFCNVEPTHAVHFCCGDSRADGLMLMCRCRKVMNFSGMTAQRTQNGALISSISSQRQAGYSFKEPRPLRVMHPAKSSCNDFFKDWGQTLWKEMMSDACAWGWTE